MTLAVAAASAVGGARADEAPDAGQTSFGVGWHLGNGLGPLGADVIAAWPHFALELQVAYIRESSGVGAVTGYAFAPAVRTYLFAAGSSPFALVGASLEQRRDGFASTMRGGLFANLGYEWRFESGIGLLAGLGGGWVGASGGVISPREPGFGLNAELGLRYMFR
ncbi:MAG TPA: hypothetical protein VFK90_14940 [Anaeromyxobacter sp.]|nr:hypothetical protein [Anaeromyxobacter sp.]